MTLISSQALPRLTGAALLLALGAAYGQTPAAPKAFDVASIKPSPAIDAAAIASGKPLHAGMKIDASRVDIGQYPIYALIMKAYDVKQYQITGPDWLMSMTAPRYDVLAKMPDGTTKDDVPEMLRTLLAERFKLVVRKESKEHPVYALTVGKGGPKMKEAEPLPAAPAPSADGGPAPPPSTGSNQVTVNAIAGKGAEVSDGQGGKQKMTMSPDGKSMRIESSRMTMAQLAEGISPLLDRPVVDETGLKGQFQVVLDFPMEELMAFAKKMGAMVPGGAGGGGGADKPADAAADPGGGSIFNMVAQLGLKLESRKAQFDQIVVERVEKTPTEN